MLTLLELFCLLLLAPISKYISQAATTTATDPCREAQSLEPLITVGLIDGVAGFCPTSLSPTTQCCSANAWTTLFPQSWATLATPFNTKLVAMEVGLRKGMEDVKGMNCPSGSQLQATTLSSLNQLGTSKWIQLLNTTTSPECRLKVVQAVICPGTCDPNIPFRLPCRNLCLNTLRGCVGDLARLALPWKHAMNNVRTAVRLLATTANSGCTNPSAVDAFLHVLSTWREPLKWLDDGCEELPQNNCYNGRDVISPYAKGVAALGASANPEFPFSEIPPGAALKPDVLEFKVILESVIEALSHHWPKLPDDTETSSDQLLSHELGSGDGGTSRKFLNTDDEDLLDSEFGSGSGDGEVDGDFDPTADPNQEDIIEESTETPQTPQPKSPQPPHPSQSPSVPPVPPAPPKSSSSHCQWSSIIFGAMGTLILIGRRIGT